MRLRPALLAGLWLALATAGAAAQNDDWDDDWDDDWGDDEWSEEESGGLTWSGFAEGALGSRWDRDPNLNRYGTLAEARLRLETDYTTDAYTLSFKGDAVLDGIKKELDGDFRELTIAGRPLASLDAKAGRQVLTWGTGDLLFLNDLFPKDFISFFAGREDEYLKAPSNTVRLTQYNSIMNIDFAWTPTFTPDEYIRGERFSFFSPFTGSIVAPEPPFGAERPSRNFENGEFSLRLFRTVKGVEYALYAHRGFFKNPTDFRSFPQAGFAPLTSFGGSVRRPWWSGLWNAEFSYYMSRDDRDGTNPALPNDQLRFLTGFEREWATNFTVGLQYYLEWTRDHDRLIENSPFPEFEPEEYRHVLTTRFSYRAMQEKLTWSLFAFVSPSDRDFYLRPVVNFRYDDAWNFTAGLNLFGGRDDFTFFGQFEDANNVYVRVRYNF